jgi:hypothetical protein
MKIVVKENDRLKSKLHNKTVSEYLVYLVDNDVNVKCFNEFGFDAKESRVKNLLETHFSNNEIKNVVEETTFENFIK